MTSHIYSSDEVDYSYNSPDELFGDGLNVGEHYWKAEPITPKPSDYFHGVDIIIERIEESMFEHVDDYASGYQESIGETKKEELSCLIKSWLDSNTECTFLVPKNPEKLTLSVHDLSEHNVETYESEKTDD